MLKGNARSLNKLMRLHFLNYILSFIIHIVTITYIVTCFFLYIEYIHCYNCQCYNVRSGYSSVSFVRVMEYGQLELVRVRVDSLGTFSRYYCAHSISPC